MSISRGTIFPNTLDIRNTAILARKGGPYATQPSWLEKGARALLSSESVKAVGERSRVLKTVQSHKSKLRVLLEA